MTNDERDRAIAFARRWVADHTDEYHHEGGDRVLALLDALIASERQARRDAVSYQDVYETAVEVRQSVAKDVFDRVCEYARELAGEGASDGE